ncbi:phosphotransferase [Isoptericola sp. NPDC056134]|uniref:phosphotransferase n=1 Tax=Isoptericola sp. NPDC056134 TaxID=3345723 RepID=UPI0035ECFE8E
MTERLIETPGRTMDGAAVRLADHVADRELVARDPAVPALADLLDPATLARRITTATGTSGVVTRPYLRYKPGTSCLLAARWVPDVGAPRDLLVRAYADHARPKLDKALRRAAPDDVVLADADAGLVVTGWATDRDLPGARLLARGGASAMLADLGLPDLGLPGVGSDGLGPDGAGPDATVRLVRHNPERRAVLHVATDGGDDILLRLVRPTAVSRAVAGYGLLAAAGVPASRVLAHDESRGVVVTRWVDGDPLDALDAAGVLGDAGLHDVGAAVAALHGSATAMPPRPARGDLARGELRPVADAVAGLLPWLTETVGPLADALDQHLSVVPGRAVPLHGDLSLDQLVRDPSGALWLVDGDAARWGAPEDDLGSLAASLVRAHEGVPTAAARLAAVLAGRDDAGAPAPDRTALRHATAAHLLRRATEPFRRRETGWAGRTARLVGLARDVLDGAGGDLGDVLDAAASRSGHRAGTAASTAGAPAVPAPPAIPATSTAPDGTGPPAERIRYAPVACELADVLADDGRRLSAVVPRRADRLLVVGTEADGRVVAGRWDADVRTAARLAARVDARAREVAGGGLVLQPDGADPDLPSLAARVREGATLVAHRSGRRGVVRDPAGTYTKVTRRGREPGDVAVPSSAFATPEVVGRGDGFVTTTALPGRTLHELLGEPHVPDPVLDEAGRSVGRGLRRLQDAPPSSGVAAHDAVAEGAVVARWWGLAAAHGATTDATADAVVRRVRAALAAAPAAPAVLTHRDLHDKQLLVHVDSDAVPGDGVRVGLLDLDLAAVAHPALDLANLLVHLELRAHQGVCPPARAARVARAVVDGYGHGTGSDPAALRAWATAARARLAAVYAFRPAPRDVPGALLTDLDRTLPFEPALHTLEDR